MKALIYFFITLIIRNNHYMEEAFPIYNKVGDLVEIDYLITLNDKINYYELNPKIFETLREYKQVKKNDKIKVNIKIRSNKNYKYLKNSFNIEPDSFLIDRNNYTFLNITGFDGKKINSIFIPWQEDLQKKETDLEKIKKAYNDFYLNILEFSYDDNIYYNMDNYKDINYNNGFTLYFKINENYKDIYKDYNYYGKISLKLKK